MGCPNCAGCGYPFGADIEGDDVSALRALGGMTVRAGTTDVRYCSSCTRAALSDIECHLGLATR